MAEGDFIHQYARKTLDGDAHQVGPYQRPISPLDYEWEEG